MCTSGPLQIDDVPLLAHAQRTILIVLILGCDELKGTALALLVAPANYPLRHLRAFADSQRLKEVGTRRGEQAPPPECRINPLLIEHMTIGANRGARRSG